MQMFVASMLNTQSICFIQPLFNLLYVYKHLLSMFTRLYTFDIPLGTYTFDIPLGTYTFDIPLGTYTF